MQASAGSSLGQGCATAHRDLAPDRAWPPDPLWVPAAAASGVVACHSAHRGAVPGPVPPRASPVWLPWELALQQSTSGTGQRVWPSDSHRPHPVISSRFSPPKPGRRPRFWVTSAGRLSASPTAGRLPPPRPARRHPASRCSWPDTCRPRGLPPGRGKGAALGLLAQRCPVLGSAL